MWEGWPSHISRLCDTHNSGWFSLLLELVIFAASTPSVEQTWWTRCISISLATESSEQTVLHLSRQPRIHHHKCQRQSVSSSKNGWMLHISRCKGFDSLGHYPGTGSNFIPEFSQLMRLKFKLLVPNTVPLAFYSTRCSVHQRHTLDHGWQLFFVVTTKTLACLLSGVMPAGTHCALRPRCPTSGWEASILVDFQKHDKSPWQ